jgi:stress-induced morphogen
MLSILVAALETPAVVVEDISGGCGSMYNVEVTSQLFEGISKVKQ